jgi:hypothetical protein
MDIDKHFSGSVSSCQFFIPNIIIILVTRRWYRDLHYFFHELLVGSSHELPTTDDHTTTAFNYKHQQQPIDSHELLSFVRTPAWCSGAGWQA